MAEKGKTILDQKNNEVIETAKSFTVEQINKLAKGKIEQKLEAEIVSNVFGIVTAAIVGVTAYAYHI